MNNLIFFAEAFLGHNNVYDFIIRHEQRIDNYKAENKDHYASQKKEHDNIKKDFLLLKSTKSYSNYYKKSLDIYKRNFYSNLLKDTKDNFETSIHKFDTSIYNAFKTSLKTPLKTFFN